MVWQYFRKQGNGETVECLQCKKIFRHNSGGTSTMFRHLRKAHGFGNDTQNFITLEALGEGDDEDTANLGTPKTSTKWAVNPAASLNRRRSATPAPAVTAPRGGMEPTEKTMPGVLLTTTKPEPMEITSDVILPEELIGPDTPVTATPGRMAKRSHIWKFFETEPDENGTVACLDCGKRFKKEGGTSTLGRHLKKKHVNRWEELEELNEQNRVEKTAKKRKREAEETLAAYEEGEEGGQEEGEQEEGAEGAEGGEGEEGKENKPKAKILAKKKGPKSRSSVWKYFQRLKNEQACCNQCGKVFAITCGTTTGLIRHLGRVHGDAYDEVVKEMGERKKPNPDAIKLTFDWTTGSFVPKKAASSSANPGEKPPRKIRKDKLDPEDPATRTCPVEGCGKVYARRRGMLVHYEAAHSNHEPYQCNECGKVFSRKEGLARHTHDEARPYLCPQCGKTFKTKRAREIHERSHFGDRRYECPYPECSKKFVTNAQRKNHIRVHTGEKPYGCGVCGKYFAAKHQVR